MANTINHNHLARMLYAMHTSTYSWIMYNCTQEDLRKIRKALQDEFVDEEGISTATLYDEIIDNIEDYASCISYDLYNSVLSPIIFGK